MALQKRFKKPEAVPISISIDRRLLSPKQAATYISHSVDIVYDMIDRRAIPYVQNGRRYLIDRVDLDRWIEKRKISAVAA
jgi:excisionase family DNA binding protein